MNRDKQIEEMDIFCFRAVLERVDGKGVFIIPFEVLAGDKFKAQTILENWLKNPEQTGYKFTRCVGITREASKRLLVKGYRKASDVAEEIFAEIDELVRYLMLNENIAIKCKEENGEWNAEYWKGKLSAFKQIRGFIDAELKKKYAESEKDK